MASSISFSDDKWTVGAVVATTAAVVAGGATAYYYWLRQNGKPIKYEEVGAVTRLHLYPIKSCRGISLDKVQCGKLGFESQGFRDREFLIVDEKNHFITARQEPSLILVTPTIIEGVMWLDAPGMDRIKVVKPADDKGIQVKCRIWGENMTALNCGAEVAGWLSKYLKRSNIKMLYFNLPASSRVPTMYNHWELFRRTDNSIFADLTAYMMLSEESVDDLNGRLINKVTINNFRPSISVSGGDAYEEESWKHVKIGKVAYRNVKPCTRCVLTTIDPETGIKDGIEPLQTLKSYKQHKEAKHRRLDGDSPVFGVHLSADTFGTIAVGDTVYASL